MHSFAFEFENEADLRETAKKLMDDLDVTGEINIKPLGEGRWRMEVNSERELRESTLEKLKGYRRDGSSKEARKAGQEAAASAEAADPADEE